MKPTIVAQLRCPISHEPLELLPIEVVSSERAGDLVRTGILYSSKAKLWYPIVNHAPLLLTFRTRLAARFAEQHADVLTQLAGYRMPDERPKPGEVAVQRIFTEEWGGLGDDQRTYFYSDGELLALHRDVWLRMSAADRARAEWVADVGCGYGKEARILAELFPSAAVFAIDLNLALVSAARELDQHPRLHPIVASLFDLPFDPGSLDHVHCQGVLHHTYSTKAGFDSIAATVRPNGSLFVWVSAKEGALVIPGWRGVLARIYWSVALRVARPILSRSPAPARNAVMIALSLLLHPLFKMNDRRPGEWRFRNTLHDLRDAFTPRYSHQHGFNEVIGWFEHAGFEPQMQSPRRYEELIGRRLFGIGVFGRRVAIEPERAPFEGKREDAVSTLK